MIHALLSAAIMAVVGLAMAGMMNDMWKETSNIQNKNNEIMLGQALRAQVSTPLLCSQSLVNKADFDPTSNLRDLRIKLNVADSDANAVQAGSVLPDWGVTVRRLQMRNITKAMDSLGGNTIYVGDLVMTARQNNGRQLEYKTKSLGKIFVKVGDATSQISACYGSDSPDSVAEYTCESLGGSFDPASHRCDLRRFLASLGGCPEGQMMKGFTSEGSLDCVNYKDSDGDGLADSGDAGDEDPRTSQCTYSYNPGCPLNGPPKPRPATGCCDATNTSSTCAYQYSTAQVCGGADGGPIATFNTETYQCNCARGGH